MLARFLWATLLMPVAIPQAAQAGVHSCSGFAPAANVCSTGSRQRVDILSHNVAADFNYIGTIESAIEWSGGRRVFRCTYTQIGPRSCLSSGEFPPVQTTFTHRCRSMYAGSVIAGLVQNGVEGGVGSWQCEVVV